MKDTIRQVVKEGGSDDYLPLVVIAYRESAFNPEVKHLHPSDVRGSIKAWERNSVKSGGDDGLKENKWINDKPLWSYGRGLFGMMTGYHIQKIHQLAHPDALLDPKLATVAACRLVFRLVHWKAYKAKNWLEVFHAWGSGSTKGNSAEDRKRREASYKKWFQELGIDPAIMYRAPKTTNWGSRPKPNDLGRFSLMGADLRTLTEVPGYEPQPRDIGADVETQSETEKITNISAAAPPKNGWLAGVGLAALAGFAWWRGR